MLLYSFTKPAIGFDIAASDSVIWDIFLSSIIYILVPVKEYMRYSSRLIRLFSNSNARFEDLAVINGAYIRVENNCRII